MGRVSKKKQKAIQKAEELDNSEQFDVHTWSEYPEVNNAVNGIYDDLKGVAIYSGNKKITKHHIKKVAIDLYVKRLTDAEMYSAIYLKKSEYKGINSRYNKLHITYKTVEVVYALEKMKYLTLVKGHYDRTGVQQSHMSRIRATEKLISLILDKYQFKPYMVENAYNTECIILRDADPEAPKKKRDIEYEDNPETIRMRKDLTVYNNLLRITSIDLLKFPKDGVYGRSKKKKIKINRNNKFVRRIFNDGIWKHGGRFYGGLWQRLPKEWRERIRINGKSVYEYDYSGLHITILYAMEGIDYWKDVREDPYEIDGLEQSERMRELLKLVLLCVINAKNETSALKAVKKEINFDGERYGWVNEESIDLKDIIHRFTDTHKKISKYFCLGYGIKLQRIDSIMAEYIINYFTKKDIPVLCVHDSFIVAHEYDKLLKNVMFKAYDMAISMFIKNNEHGFYKKVKGAGMSAKIHVLLLNQLKTVEGGFLGREEAFIKLGMTIKDPEYDQRIKEHKSLKWDKEYYRIK